MTRNEFRYDALWHIYAGECPDFIARLAGTPPMQRLKQVGMNCGCEYTVLHRQDMCRRYTRFEHSVGVALIVWHFTRDEKQAAAGLFHDISTPAFAHVVDFMNGDHLTQESTESRTAEIIAQSPDIQAILSERGLCTDDVCDYHLYPIADNPSPQLSADRLEYTFGNFIQYGFAGIDEIRRYYDALTAGFNESGEQELLFTHPALAEQFALRSMKCSYVYVSDADRFSMQYLAEGLKQAVSAGVLTIDDLYTTEENVIAKLLNHPGAGFRWADYTAIQSVCRTKRRRGEGFCVRVNAKRRYIDPFAQGAGRVTSYSEAYRAEVRQFLAVSFDDWLSEA